MAKIISERVKLLRTIMKKYNISHYFVPSADAHRNEYVPESEKRREWISGFTGSAGDALIGIEQSLFWTDGRYTAQAKRELDFGLFDLMGNPQGVRPDIAGWVNAQNFPIQLGYDPRVLSISEAQKLKEIIIQKGGEFKAIDLNLIDLARAALEKNLEKNLDQNQKTNYSKPIRIQSIKYSGWSCEDKIKQIRKKLSQNNAQALIINSLDEIAWLLNIRGDDIAYNPLVMSYLILTQDKLFWYVGLNRVNTNKDLKHYCEENNIIICEYDDFYLDLNKLSGSIWLDPSVANFKMLMSLDLNQTQTYFKSSPIILTKAMKHPVEIKGAIDAHVIDGIALVKFMHWLDQNVSNGEITELSATEKLNSFRAESEYFQGESFTTIAGFAENGAVIHYASSPKTNKIIAQDSLFLVDSGAQYPQGTTDVTRTMHFGEPSLNQKRHYTLVLKGHLNIANAVFPKGTTGGHIDVLAKSALWKNALDYRHGTGHGVGSNLCVHEGPQAISPRLNTSPLLPGMIVSNEPGFYLEGEYGIRIENLCVVSELKDNLNQNTYFESSEYGPFYGFKNLTCAPYARNLIDIDLLSQSELDQINHYHQWVLETLTPYFKNTHNTILEWLIEQTKVIQK